MNKHAALELVEFIIEELHSAGFIPERDYGRMTVDFQQELADMVVAKSEE